jgi:hypothetical protein
MAQDLLACLATALAGENWLTEKPEYLPQTACRGLFQPAYRVGKVAKLRQSRLHRMQGIVFRLLRRIIDQGEQKRLST